MAYFRELGTGGGGGILVEVNELPTSNIDESKIYLVNKTETTVSAYICADGMIVNGSDMGIATILVNSLDEIIAPNETTIYVLKDTGIGYAYVGDYIPVSSAFGVPDLGFVSELPAITPEGWICYLKTETKNISIGVPNEEQNKSVFSWNGQSWGISTPPYEIEPLISINEPLIFLLVNNVAVRITENSVEELEIKEEWAYRKFTANAINYQSYNVANHTVSDDSTSVMQRVYNTFVCPSGWTYGVDGIKVDFYIGFIISRDLSKCVLSSGSFNIMSSRKMTETEWNDLLSQLGITTT
jgi:hypothetical protein